MKWQKLVVVVTAIVAVVAMAPMAHSVTLKAKVDLKFVDQGSGNLDKPQKVNNKSIIDACAAANDLSSSDLTLVFIQNSSSDPEDGVVAVVDKADVTNVRCQVLSVSEGTDSTTCKAGSTTSSGQAVFTFFASGIETNSVDLDAGFGAFGIATGKATFDSTDCSGNVLGATFKANVGGESDNEIYEGSIAISGKDLEPAP